MWTSEAATEDTASEDEETFHDTEEKIMKKGRHRHVREGLKDIMECMVAEAKAKVAGPNKPVPNSGLEASQERTIAVHRDLHLVMCYDNDSLRQRLGDIPAGDAAALGHAAESAS